MLGLEDHPDDSANGRQAMSGFKRITYEMKNHARSITPIVIGEGVPKIVTIVGITDDDGDIAVELDKAKLAVKHGSSIVGDVSTKRDIGRFLDLLIRAIPLPISTVPFYEIHQIAENSGDWERGISRSLVLDIIESQADRGIDCMTMHAAIQKADVEYVATSTRQIALQARGGGLLYEYMTNTGNENPLYEHFDDICEILQRHGVTLSIGCSLRTGTIDDPIDAPFVKEMLVQSRLAQVAMSKGVNVMIEGLSHIRYDLVSGYVKWAKECNRGVPLRLLGPLSTERGLGYDHITAALSAVPAIAAGVDVLTCVTRSEHIGLPESEDIREAIVALRIAIALSSQSNYYSNNETNFQCGMGFEELNAEQVIDLEKALSMKIQKGKGALDSCTMCNDTCRIVLGNLKRK